MRKYRSRRGFALIIALVLMGFIMLLLLSLSTLTTVEINRDFSSQREAAARKSALLGLSMALGELQRFAGPDQRVTAPADLKASKDRLGNSVSGSDLLNIENGTRYWTGVWGNRNSASDLARDPLLLNWLVSGNSNADFSVDTSSASFGKVSVGSARQLEFTPESVVSGVNAGMSANADISIDGKPARLMMGSGSVGGNAEDYVIAPLVDIDGQSENGITVRYAWWIGDEGVKVRVNMNNAWSDALPAGGQDVIDWSFFNAQRPGVRVIDGLEAFPIDDGGVENVLLEGQLQLLGVNRNSLRDRFHDYSTFTNSLLTDVRYGGVKRDLTFILDDESFANAAEKDDAYVFPSQADAGAPFYTQPPTWGLLRDYVNYRGNRDALPSQAPSASQQGISPVLMSFELYYTVRVEESPADAEKQIVSVMGSPRLVLWNPYNHKLEKGKYEVGYAGPRRSTGLSGGMLILGNDAGANFYFNLGKNKFESSTSAERSFLRFTVNMRRDWEPGEAVGFRLADGTLTDYADGIELVNASESSGEHVVFDRVILDKSSEYSSLLYASNWDIAAANNGVIDMYLGEDGVGANPSASLSPGADNRVFQWLGRIGAVMPVDRSTDPYNRTLTKNWDTSAVVVGDPEDMHVIKMHVYNGIATVGTAMPPLPTRWIAAANSRAYMINRTGMERGQANQNVINPLFVALITDNSSPEPRMSGWSNSGGDEVFFSQDYNDASAKRPILFELPAEDEPLFSIANLQHAAVGAHVVNPSYAIGNSIADMRIPTNETAKSVDAGWRDTNDFSGNPGVQTVYDLSWHLNDALWDRYYFSTIPANGTIGQRLPNGRYRRVTLGGGEGLPDADLRDPSRNAAGLVMAGGFNVNSTSSQAWRAVLASLNGIPLEFDESGGLMKYGTGSLEYPIPRFRNPIRGSNSPWNGFRDLQAEHIEQMAQALVDEVRQRGPFLSMSDFVNRSVTANEINLRLKGALQAAIDNEPLGNATTAVNYVGGSAASTVPDRELDLRGLVLVNGSGAGGTWYASSNQEAMYGHNGTANAKPYSSRSAFAPGYLTQADVLSAIGSSLTVRSDTFRVRSYGEILGVDGNVEARAWCEAIVQRLPDYVDEGADSAWTDPAALSSDINKQLGRRFVLISFRWLSADEI